MGEYFDLTFFLDKEKAEKACTKKQMLETLEINEGKTMVQQHQYPLLSQREVVFSGIEEFDFIQYYVSLSDIIFTKKNFDSKLSEVLQVVEACFNQVDSILFATGLYELTPHYLVGITSVKDFNKSIFEKFPFKFFRKENEYGLKSTQQHGNISYIVSLGQNVQDIFANPISELMEDYGMSFEEAKEKAKW